MVSFMGKLILAADDESPKLPLPSASIGLAWTVSGPLQGSTVAYVCGIIAPKSELLKLSEDMNLL
jgi:hypothetical protein